MPPDFFADGGEMPKNEVSVTVENFQIIGDDTLRVDLSFVGTVKQDGKELTLNHERQTVYVNTKGMPPETAYRWPSLDPRQKGKQ